MSTIPRTPSLGLALTDLPRAGVESAWLLASLRRLIRRHRGGDAHPVLVLPGYGAADGATAALRYFIGRIGYNAFTLGLGRNVEGAADRIQSVDDATRFRDRMSELTARRVREIHAETGQSVSLVGWSMGGLYALDAARAQPDVARQVITLGTPFGDPRGTSLFMLMRRLSGSTVPIENQDFGAWLERAAPVNVPTRIIYSQRDGIVGTDIARLESSSQVEHIQVASSHTGFALNPRAFQAVARCLAAS